MMTMSEADHDVEAAALEADEALLRVRNLNVSYGGVKALSDLSFDIPPRGVCGVIGPNGAGKTTLLDVLAGLRSPTSGSVTLAGREVSGKSSTWLARHGVHRTFQRQQPFAWLTVEENVLVALEWRGGMRHIGSDLLLTPARRRKTAVFRRQVDALLEQYGLDKVRNTPAAHLTIGQMRMLEFVRAIADRPRMLLLDEPTSGLGHAETARLGEAVRRISSDCSVILVEHDLPFVLANCERLILLNLGRIVVDRKISEIRMNPAIISEYMGVVVASETDADPDHQRGE
jgi:branched-chain amino acid transport system ATP-binding protein